MVTAFQCCSIGGQFHSHIMEESKKYESGSHGATEKESVLESAQLDWYVQKEEKKVGWVHSVSHVD